MKDAINPDHYRQGSIECIEAIEAATINKTGIEAACVANVIKYLWRYEAKNGLEDIKKARWYMDKLIEVLTRFEPSGEDSEWIEWRGGECPVNKNTVVQVLHRDATKRKNFADFLYWDWVGAYNDIIAYRIIK